LALNSTGPSLLFSTTIGGSSWEWAYGLALDSVGNAYVTGQTLSTDFPTTAGALQTTPGGGFVFKINSPHGCCRARQGGQTGRRPPGGERRLSPTRDTVSEPCRAFP
jgi:hypothetical protein